MLNLRRKIWSILDTRITVNSQSWQMLEPRKSQGKSSHPRAHVKVSRFLQRLSRRVALPREMLGVVF